MARPRARLARLGTARLAVSLPKSLLVLAFLVGLSLALRTQAIHARFWIDEGLSVGISSHPLGDIPGVLRNDGSPPLYYLILKLWTSSDFGRLTARRAVPRRARRARGRAMVAPAALTPGTGPRSASAPRSRRFGPRPRRRGS